MSAFGWSYPAGCSGPPDDDEPTECVCGAPNWSEAAENIDGWICGDAPGFCSTRCRDEYVEAERLAAEEEARELGKAFR